MPSGGPSAGTEWTGVGTPGPGADRVGAGSPAGLAGGLTVATEAGTGGGGSGIWWRGSGGRGSLTVSVICGKGVSIGVGKRRALGGTGLGGSIFRGGGGGSGRAGSPTITSSTGRTDGFEACADMIHRSASRRATIDPRWSRQDTPTVSARPRMNPCSMGRVRLLLDVDCVGRVASEQRRMDASAEMTPATGATGGLEEGGRRRPALFGSRQAGDGCGLARLGRDGDDRQNHVAWENGVDAGRAQVRGNGSCRAGSDLGLVEAVMDRVQAILEREDGEEQNERDRNVAPGPTPAERENREHAEERRPRHRRRQRRRHQDQARQVSIDITR